jgi:hypothetical protein
MRALSRDEVIIVRGSRPPWQRVLDPLAGYLLYAESLFERADLPPALNVGLGK